MALLKCLVIVIAISMFKTSYSQSQLCDAANCDFGTCNNCKDDEYICTDKAETCLLKCNINCRNITIISSAKYTQIICNAHYSCTNTQIHIQQANTTLDLQCKKSSSCSNIIIHSHRQTTFQCDDYGSSQCTNNIHMQFPSISPTLNPTVIPTSNATLNSTLYPVLYPALNLTLNPTQISLLLIATPAPISKPTSPDTTDATKTVLVYTAQTQSKSDIISSFATVLISVTIMWLFICIAAVICVKIYKRRMIAVLPIANNINKAARTSEGVMSGMRQYDKRMESDDTDNGLYEGIRRNATQQYEFETIDENIDTGHVTVELQLDDLDLPKPPLSASHSSTLSESDDLHLLYGPGTAANNKTLNYF